MPFEIAHTETLILTFIIISIFSYLFSAKYATAFGVIGVVITGLNNVLGFGDVTNSEIEIYLIFVLAMFLLDVFID